MVFSSIDFIFIFLPIFLAVYYFTVERYRNLCLLIFSLIFYGYGALKNPLYIVLMIVSVCVNYLLALGIDKYKDSDRKKKITLAAGLFYNFGWLFVFKYADFFGQTIGKILKLGTAIDIPKLNLLLPIGISFYTFQAVSYLVDVYRETSEVEKNLVNMAAYITMFPQLIAGPIVRFGDISQELRNRELKYRDFIDGVKFFILGLGFKVLLANQIGNLWSDISAIGVDSISTTLAWMGIYGYSLQLYFDFYGYSLMAIGLGKMMGFNLPANFNRPYISVTMTEFWRRWHMTLGTWFREYVYIPLGGNRKGSVRKYINLLIVWLLTGLWHGADWNFLLWGLFLFVLTAMEKACWGKYLEKHRWLGHIYMLFVIPLSWLMFVSEDLSFMGQYLQRLAGIPGQNVFAQDYLKFAKLYGVLLAAGFACSILPIQQIFEKMKNRLTGTIILAAVFAACVYCMYMGMNDPFLYFRF